MQWLIKNGSGVKTSRDKIEARGWEEIHVCSVWHHNHDQWCNVMKEHVVSIQDKIIMVYRTRFELIM